MTSLEPSSYGVVVVPQSPTGISEKRSAVIAAARPIDGEHEAGLR